MTSQTPNNGLSRSLEGARDAFQTLDTEASRVAHDMKAPSKELHEG
jgi:hypothetical protein